MFWNVTLIVLKLTQVLIFSFLKNVIYFVFTRNFLYEDILTPLWQDHSYVGTPEHCTAVPKHVSSARGVYIDIVLC